jgi:hypothetical protein
MVKPASSATISSEQAWNPWRRNSCRAEAISSARVWALFSARVSRCLAIVTLL